MEINYSDIGKRIKDNRIKAGFTQEKLAELVDLSTQHLSGIENGKTKFSFQTIVNIANELNTSTDMLLCGSLKQGTDIIQGELSELIADCTTDEATIIIDTLKALKRSLRQNRINSEA